MYMKTIVISVLALLVLQHAVKLCFKLDYHKHIFNHYPGPCHQVQGMGIGSEDMHLIDNGTVFISSGYRLQGNSPAYDKFYSENNVTGRIYLFDMNNPKKEVQEMSLTSTKEFDKERFQPHGISAWEDKKTGKLYLYAVNHERDGEEKIEKFLVSVAKLSLQHLKSYFGDPTIRKMNDVVATGDDSFYFTNSHTFGSNAGLLLELISLMALSDVGVHDGKGYRTVADGISVANGIQMSRDGKYVFVAGSMGHDLKIYERRNDNSLTLKQSYVFHSFPDNIMEDPVSGDLYIAFHPIGHLLFHHFVDHSLEAPSQVLQVKLKEGTVSSVTELFVDDGHLVSGSSVAVVYKKKMLIGSVINKLVYCDVTVPL
ncbi:serum paraoxonase/arylesterase 1-like [Haliotis rubra]|uniref:serum paraoxonase/arylesterase 1-like n=1 Tax=Haliotis rubra TaxID=36100 RepID=UPI001EE57D93|nr:serum paraoxonase/arylesterase 1-like [Haliotis rubra]XP_046584015.1 serum paraoxonase/arylesterase 1-like [Haliotis rubra]XP_046584016.1 serum paraoxonase/arylesterase 1-like [Haliotis rubra]